MFSGKPGISNKTVEKAINDKDNLFLSPDVEENLMENLKDDLDLLKTKFNMHCDVTVEDLGDLDLDVCITSKSSDKDIIKEISGNGTVDTEEECKGEKLSGDVTKQSFDKSMNAITVLVYLRITAYFSNLKLI